MDITHINRHFFGSLSTIMRNTIMGDCLPVQAAFPPPILDSPGCSSLASWVLLECHQPSQTLVLLLTRMNHNF